LEVFNFYGAQKSIPPAYVAGPVRQPYPIPFLVPIYCSKILSHVIEGTIDSRARIFRPGFRETIPRLSFSTTEIERFGLVFTKTGSINPGTGID